MASWLSFWSFSEAGNVGVCAWLGTSNGWPSTTRLSDRGVRVFQGCWKDGHFALQLVNSPATSITLWYLEGLFCGPKIKVFTLVICVIGVNHESRAIFRSDLLLSVVSFRLGPSWGAMSMHCCFSYLAKNLQRCISLFWMPSLFHMNNAIVILVIHGIVRRWKQSVGYRQSAQQISPTHHWGGSPQSFCWLVKVLVTLLASTSLSSGAIYYIDAKFQRIESETSGNPLNIFCHPQVWL